MEQQLITEGANSEQVRKRLKRFDDLAKIN